MADDGLISGRSARAQARKAFEAETRQRYADQRQDNHTLLMPDEVSGDYLLSRGLFTTLHKGELRAITHEDLRAFRDNVRRIKGSFQKAKIKGGIKAKTIIDRSLPEDRKRANAQIHMAQPTHYQSKSNFGQGNSLVVHFLTSAGPDSDVRNHHVNVEFLDFGAAVASPVKADKIAVQMLRGALRFECDCGRHKYWLRYIATLGEYNYGRPETGFPKIRNPNLVGIACKHVLRVMHNIQNATAMRNYAQVAIQRAKDNIEHTGHVERLADQRRLQQALAQQKPSKKAITTTDERRAKRQAQPGWSKAEERRREIAAERAAARQAKETAATINAAEANIRKLQAQGVLSQDQAKQMLATLGRS